jgi:uncharacterized LabA/DUF88 family protein
VVVLTRFEDLLKASHPFETNDKEGMKMLNTISATKVGIWRKGVFIDAQNILMCAKVTHPNHFMNYQNLLKFLSEDNAVLTFTVFYPVDPTNESQAKFVMALARMGYRVVTKSIKKMPNGNIKANMDMEMALEILEQAPFLDEIVIVSGDGDFVSLINLLCRMGKKVVVIGPDQYTAHELIHACHEFISISQIPGFLEPSGR